MAFTAKTTLLELNLTLTLTLTSYFHRVAGAFHPLWSWTLLR